MFTYELFLKPCFTAKERRKNANSFLSKQLLLLFVLFQSPGFKIISSSYPVEDVIIIENGLHFHSSQMTKRADLENLGEQMNYSDQWLDINIIKTFLSVAVVYPSIFYHCVSRFQGHRVRSLSHRSFFRPSMHPFSIPTYPALRVAGYTPDKTPVYRRGNRGHSQTRLCKNAFNELCTKSHR